MNNLGVTTPGTPARGPRGGLHRRGLIRAWTPRGRSRAGSMVVVALVAVLGAGVQLVATAPLHQAAAAPGVPNPPVVVFNEDFENNADNTATGAKAFTTAGGATQYVGTTPAGQTYTADANWINGDRCDGIVLSYNNGLNVANGGAPAWATTTSTQANQCSPLTTVQSYNGIRTLARALGSVVGGGDDNHMVSSYTECTQDTAGNIPSGGCDTLPTGPTASRMFQTNLGIPVSPNHFYTFAVDAVAGNCSGAITSPQPSDPKFQFQLVSGATRTDVGAPLNPCRDASRQAFTVSRPLTVGSATMSGFVSRLRADSAFLFPGSSLGVAAYNTSGITLGNDGGFDNIQVQDVTPALDKAFSPASLVVGGNSTLTFTITNTSDLLAKNDMAFTDTLPAGLVVSSTPATSTTCGNGTVGATAGGSVVTVAGADLAAGATTCTVSVSVTASAAGSYSNGAANVTGLIGLNPPPTASVTFFDTDFGDAPASYGTATASHTLSGIVGAPSTPTLALGATRDMEAAAAVTAGATGDDTTGSDDEDAVSGTPTFITNGAMSLAVPLRNTTGATATLAGWVDFNRDGAFQATELVTASVPAGATTATLTWPVNLTASAGASFLRLRLFPGTVATPSPTTAAVGGEIEDHPVTLSRSGIVVDKTANVSTGVSPVAVTYTYAVTGQLEPLRNVTLTDDRCSVPATKTGDVNGDNILQPLETWVFTCAASLTTTTTNTATATGIGTLSGATVTNTDTWTVTVTAPSLNLSKTGGTVSGPNAAGNYTATYTVRVSNTGTASGTYGPITDTPAFAPNLAVTGASWTGQATGSATGAGPFAIGAAGTTIAVGVTHTYNVTVTFHYTNATQASACAGTGTGLYNSVALAAGQEQGATTDNAACIAPPVPPAPAIALTKSISSTVPSPLTGAGQTVNYRFAVTNPGVVQLTSPRVNDSRCTPNYSSGDTNADGILQNGETWIFTCAYTTTQADVDAGAVNNTATAQGTPPYLTTPVTSAPSSTSVTIAEVPVIDLTKTAAAVTDVDGNGPDAGDRITFGFTVRNAGNTTLSIVSIADPALNLAALQCVATLAPGESTTCTAVHALTQDEVDDGGITNTATATALPPKPSDPPATGTDTAVTTVASDPSVTIEKSAGTPTTAKGRVDTVTDAGDTVVYTLLVTNTGDVTLDPVRVTDAKLGLDSVVCDGGSALAPGAGATCAFSYTLLQSDIDAGRVDNLASVSGTPPTGAPVSYTDIARVDLTPTNALSLTKAASAVNDLDRNGPDAGDTVDYTFSVTNDGTTTLAPVTITDSRLGGPAFTCVASLAPGRTATCDGPTPYVLTQADIDAGAVVNVATATGDAAVGPDPTDGSTATVDMDNLATVTLVKQAGAPTVGAGALATVTDAGDSVTYTFEVTNTSNLTLTGVQVTDPRLGTVTCPSTTLAAHTSMSCTAAAYVLTQADIDRGRVDNTATLVATGPQGPVPSVTDTAAVTLTPVSAIGLVKSASAVTDLDGNGTDVGDSVTYSFTVTNRGATTLEPVAVTDAKLALAGMPCGSGPLAPGASRTCAAPAYALTQADLDAGHVENAATVTGRGPTGSSVTADGSVSFQTAGSGAITLRKSATLTDTDGDGTADAGETIDYGFTVTNSGSVTLTSIRITDAMLGIDDALCATGSLGPGESVACSELVTRHRVTAQEVTAGQVRNVATATGERPGGQVVRDADAVTTPVDPPAASPPPLEFRDDPSPLPDGLAFTGSNAFTMLGAALALLMVGFLLLLGRRRGELRSAAPAGRHRK